MKFAIGPRRIGKSTVALKEFLNAGDAVFVTAYHIMIPHVVSQINELVSSPIKFNRENLSFEYNGKVKYIVSLQTALEKEFNDKMTDIPKYLDNMEIILDDIFGNVKLATATGPNYKWDTKLYETDDAKDWLKDAANRMSEDNFKSELTFNWDEKDLCQKAKINQDQN